jgi:predicted restriction endonuclease
VTAGLRLTIELVPRTSWCDNMRTVVRRQTWDEIRKAAYRASDYRCAICGGTGQLSCHEHWA